MEELLGLLLTIRIEDADPAGDLLKAAIGWRRHQNGIDPLQPFDPIGRIVALDEHQQLCQLGGDIGGVGVAELI